MKRILGLCFILILLISTFPIYASDTLTKETALTLIEEAYNMYADNDDYHDNIPQKQSDEYWKGRIPYIFTKEFGDWLYEPYVEKSTFGKYTLHDNYKETFRFLSNENGEAKASIDVKYRIFEEWDYSLIIIFKYTSNGWRISGVDHSSVFKDIPNLNKDKIDNDTIESLIYNSFIFYRFLYQASNFLVEGNSIADPIKVDGLDEREYVSDLFVCKKAGLDTYKVWEDLSRCFFEEDIAVKVMNNKRYLREFNGKAYFVHSSTPQYEFYQLPDNILDNCKIESNGDGKAKVIFDIVHYCNGPSEPDKYPVTVEFTNINGVWSISGGTFTEEFYKIYANPKTEDTVILAPLVICALAVMTCVRYKYKESLNQI